jgi:hypothetical protein
VEALFASASKAVEEHVTATGKAPRQPAAEPFARLTGIVIDMEPF